MAYLDRFIVHDQEYSAQLTEGFRELEARSSRRPFYRTRAIRLLLFAALASSGVYVSDLLIQSPACVPGTHVQVVDTSRLSALRGTFISKGCEVAGDEKLVTLSRPQTGEQYAAPVSNVRKVTQ